MKNGHLFKLLLLVSACILTLLACGDNPTPILVYVTPTPADTTGPIINNAPAENTPTVTDAPPADTLVAQHSTSTPTPGPYFGPIIGNSYTPEPLHTPLPATVSERLCPVIISAPLVSLYESPDFASNTVGTATERQRLVVAALSDDKTWASTANGWLPLVDANGTPQANLDSMRACDILLGNQAAVTLAGLHLFNGGRPDEVLDFVQQMLDSGHPLGTIKGLNNTESLLNEVKRISPQTVVVYHSLRPEQCPPELTESDDPVQAAQTYIQDVQPAWDQVNADFYQIITCQTSMEWNAQYAIEAMRLANEQERCLLLFTFPVGGPDLTIFPGLYPAYRYAVEHPCAPGRTHGIAMTARSLSNDSLASEADIWVTFRHRLLYEHLLADVPEAANLPLYYTEFGIGGGTIMPSCDTIIRDVLQYSYQLEEDPYVKGFHTWNVSKGEQWYDITPCLDDLATALITYYGGPK